MRVVKRLILLLVVLGLGLAYVCFFRFVEVDGQSMQPTYQDGTTLMVRLWGSPERNDVVAVYSSILHEDLCKRVIAVAGDTVEIKKGKVYVNDSLLDEPFNEDITTEFEKATVPKDRVFVLGDNRNNSLDSRKIGAIPTENIRAIVLFDLHLSYNVLNGILIVLLVLLLIKCLYDGVNTKESIQVYNPDNSLDYDIHLKHYKTVEHLQDLTAKYVIFVSEYETDVEPEPTKKHEYSVYDSEKIKQEYIKRQANVDLSELGD